MSNGTQPKEDDQNKYKARGTIRGLETKDETTLTVSFCPIASIVIAGKEGDKKYAVFLWEGGECRSKEISAPGWDVKIEVSVGSAYAVAAAAAGNSCVEVEVKHKSGDFELVGLSYV